MKHNLATFPKLEDYHYQIDQVEELKKAHEHLTKTFNEILDWKDDFKNQHEEAERFFKKMPERNIQDLRDKIREYEDYMKEVLG